MPYPAVVVSVKVNNKTLPGTDVPVKDLYYIFTHSILPVSSGGWTVVENEKVLEATIFVRDDIDGHHVFSVKNEFIVGLYSVTVPEKSNP